MRAAALVALLVLAPGCASNHHVSALPDLDTLAPIAPPDDLAGQLVRIDGETAGLGLELVAERHGKLRGGGAIVARGYEGVDALGRPLRATRVATPAGIVLALGPGDERSGRADPTELVPCLQQSAYCSATDLDGDGDPEVVTRDATGVLAVFHVSRLGSSRATVELAWPPTRGEDVDGDGRVDLVGEPDVGGDALAPRFVDVATAASGQYSHATAAARAIHARSRDDATARIVAAMEKKRVVDVCRAALERAFHAALAGDDAKDAARIADMAVAPYAPLPDGIQQAWVRWRGLLAR